MSAKFKNPEGNSSSLNFAVGTLYCLYLPAEPKPLTTVDNAETIKVPKFNTNKTATPLSA